MSITAVDNNRSTTAVDHPNAAGKFDTMFYSYGFGSNSVVFNTGRKGAYADYSSKANLVELANIL